MNGGHNSVMYLLLGLGICMGFLIRSLSFIDLILDENRLYILAVGFITMLIYLKIRSGEVNMLSLKASIRVIG